MGRREKPVDPAAGPVQRFAFELRKLRQEAGGPSYRAMAQRAGFSVTALSQAAAGEKLPSLPVALAYVEACDGDRGDWEERWRTAEQEAARQPAPSGEDDAHPPYQGLARFDPGDEHHFFGRSRLTDELVRHASDHRLTLVFGPSGSGKSSLLRAGLIPRLSRIQDPARRPAAMRILTPGARPLRTHRHLFTPTEGDGDTWLIVDQFEEVFTLCHDLDERAQFIDLLLTADDSAGRLRVVLGVRADFYGRCLEHRGLAAAVGDASVPVGPLSPTELREVIVKPASAAGLVVERALTARLVEEAEAEPGSLPLLSHALLETWRHRRGRALTAATYESIGGIQGAVARTAETAYTRLSPDQGELARRILLRLITPGDGTPDTRRPVDRAEVDTDDSADAALVLERLARARLITLDEQTVDLAHEALITSWPRLRTWIERDRERLRLHRRLTEAAQAWDELGCDPGALYRGARLAAAEDAFNVPSRLEELTTLERAFLAESLSARDQERRAAVRTSRRLRSFAVSVSVLLVLALIAGVIAWQQNRTNERLLVQAEARRIAAVADGMRASDPRTAMRLSVAAWQLADLPETRSALYGAGAQRSRDAFRIPDSTADDITLSADGRTAVVSVGGKAERWDVRSQRRISSIRRPGDDPDAPFVISPDVRTAAAWQDGGLYLWDLASGRRVGQRIALPAVEDPSMGGVEFSPSGRSLVVTGQRRENYREKMRMWLWDIEERRTLFDREIEPSDRDNGIAWTYQYAVSVDDSLLALCLQSRPLQVWDVRHGKRLRGRWEQTAATDQCDQAAFRFAPDSRSFAMTAEAQLNSWDVRSGKQLPAIEHQAIGLLEFSADGEFLAASDEKEVLLWRPGTPTPVFRHPLGTEVVGAVRINRADRTLTYVTGAAQGVVRTLDLGHAVDPGWQTVPTAWAELSPDGRLLATVRVGSEHNRVRLIDTRIRKTVADLPTGPCPKEQPDTAPEPDKGTPPASTQCSATERIAFSPDSRYFAYGAIPSGRHRPITVIDSRSPLRRTELPLAHSPDESRGGGEISDIALSPGGTRLYVGRAPGGESIEVWDVRRKVKDYELSGAQDDFGYFQGDGLAVRPDGRLVAAAARWGPLAWINELDTRRAKRPRLTPNITTTIAFSPDGRLFAAGDIQGNVTLWDGEVGRRLAEFTPTDSDASGSVSALAFAPDGRFLAVGDDRGGLRLWETTGAGRRALGSALNTGGDPILSLAFASDGTTLYAAGANVPLLTYSLAPGDVAADVRRRARGGLSEAEWKTHIRAVPFRSSS